MWGMWGMRSTQILVAPLILHLRAWRVRRTRWGRRACASLVGRMPAVGARPRRDQPGVDLILSTAKRSGHRSIVSRYKIEAGQIADSYIRTRISTRDEIRTERRAALGDCS
jgi:hypothetical protein